MKKKVIIIIYTLLILGLIFWKVVLNLYQYGFHKWHVEIKQTVSEARLSDNTYYVSTEVWVRNLFDFPVTLEKSFQEVQTPDKIMGTKINQMEEAVVVKDKVEGILRKGR